MTSVARVLLCGGGHAHLEVLRRSWRTPDPRQQMTLVSPDAMFTYSGMVPGVIAGHYDAAEAQIPLAPLARVAGATFIEDRVMQIDLGVRVARLQSGSSLPFDVLSLDVGSTTDLALPGAREHAIAIRPFERLLAAVDGFRARIANASLRIAVVGGGAAGVELAFAIRHGLAQPHKRNEPEISLVTDLPCLLPGHPAGVGARVMRLCALQNIAVHVDCRARGVSPSGVATATGIIGADAVILSTTSVAPPWLAETALARDDGGFVYITDALQSVSHPFVFAAGDCASRVADPRPKSGVYAVRAGPPLAHNLRQYVRRAPLAQHRPQRQALALITTGGRHAIASRPPVRLEGAWVWRWKDRIDRRFVGRYRIGG
jgi:pyridine nucleotide-disulfide oxidoreductase family protein